MARVLNIVVLVALAIALVVVIVIAATAGNARDMAHAEFAIPWIARAIGVFVATVATLVLLFKTIEGATLEQTPAFVVVLLAAALLIEPHWALGLGLSAVVVALTVKETVRLLGGRKQDQGLGSS